MLAITSYYPLILTIKFLVRFTKFIVNQVMHLKIIINIHTPFPYIWNVGTSSIYR